MGARAEEFKSETVIMHEGSNVDHRMYIVLDGEVIVYRNYGKSDEYLIGVFGKGKTFGEMNLFSSGPTLFTAVAYTDVKVAWFERNNLENFIKNYPENAMQMIENLSRSFILMEKNLEMAINEINELRKLQEKSESEKLEQLSFDDIRNELAKATSGKGEFRFIHGSIND